MNLVRFHFYYAIRWIKYYFGAKTCYDVHSPYLSRFTEEVVEDQRWFYTFSIVEPLRQQMLHNRTRIKRLDHGAGSKVDSSAERTIRSIAQSSALSPAEGRLLFRIVNFLKPTTLLELGTSLGISTLYQAGAVPHARILTVEGCPATARVADANFRQMGAANITLQLSTFADSLPLALQKLGKLDFLYLDGDHRKTPSLEYIRQCLLFAHEQSVFVIADIHWSKEMEEAWAEMKTLPEVTLSIDLFSFGLLFFRKETLHQQHIKLVRHLYKPWRMGFWG
ncbi:MAG: O-methyltransferase [Saprospiraceae bacterium]|nr:MAG: O-methyltransferase [Saprospiraceae bacterium]